MRPVFDLDPRFESIEELFRGGEGKLVVAGGL
jgi:hypothetical protein